MPNEPHSWNFEKSGAPETIKSWLLQPVTVEMMPVLEFINTELGKLDERYPGGTFRIATSGHDDGFGVTNLNIVIQRNP